MSSFFRILNSKKVVPYIFISFPILLIYGLIGYPLIRAAYMSFFDWHMLHGKRDFKGIGNYVDLFNHPLISKRFINSFNNTIILAVSYVVLGIIIGLVFALIVNHMSRGTQKALKSIYFLPVIVAMVPVSIAFKYMMKSDSTGPLNYYLSFIGISPVQWLTSAKWALRSVLAVTLWKNVGFIMVIYLAGILGIPRTYYEAAKIDGASGWSAFRSITLPLLKNTTVFLMVTGFINVFQAYTQITVLTNGYGPQNSTSLLGWEIYQQAFTFHSMGSASAMGFVMLIFILIATLLQLKYFSGKKTG